MNDLEIRDDIIEQFKAPRSIPADVTNLTIAAINGRHVQLSGNPGGATNAWRWGILEITSGAAKDKKAVIVESGGSVVTLSGRFGKRKPAVGDSVKLSGGPLKLAKIMKDEPDSIKKHVDDGVKYFVFVSSLTGDLGWHGLKGGRDTTGSESGEEVFGFSVIGTVPNITGTTTNEAIEARDNLSIFKEQLVRLIHAYKADEENMVIGTGPISYGYSGITVIGTDQVNLKACLIEFDVLVTN